MEFDWDDLKSEENERKHGVSFEKAIVLWDGVHLEVENIARSDDGEKRGATMGWIDNKIYVAIWTKRGVKIRLISVRRARENEEKTFFQEVQNRG